jgi:translocation and assembly module TamB
MTRTATPAAPPATPPVAAPPRRSGLRWLAAALLAFLVVLTAVIGAAAWLLRTEAGTAWLLTRLPGVQAEGIRGALLGPDFEAQRLVVQWAPQASLSIDGLQARELRWSWRPAPGAWLGLRAATVQAERITVLTGPAADTPPTPPTLPPTLRLPLQAEIARVQVGELQIDALTPLRGLSLKLQIGAEHRIDELAFSWDRLRAQGGALRLAADAPYALQGALQLVGIDGTAPPWQAALQAEGVLDRLRATARLSGESPRGSAAPTLDLSAELAPLRPWPLLALSARTQALDLSALASGMPQTRLSGRADLQGGGAGQPLNATVALENVLAGPWDAGRLPIARAELTLAADLQARDRVELSAFDLRLGEGGNGGRWRGSGLWQGDTLALDMRLDGVRPQRLHRAAPAAHLSGPLVLSVRGLPSPADAEPRLDLAALAGDLRGTLDGRLDGKPQALRLGIDASAADGRLLLRSLRAQAGAASAQARLDAQRGRGGSWRLGAKATLEQFDPLLWWPGIEGSARPGQPKGANRLTADAELDLLVPAGAAAMEPLDLAKRLGGRGGLQVQDSLLAGVPMKGSLQLEQEGAGAATISRLQADMRLGGNRLVLEGRGKLRGDGSDDRLHAELQAPDIGTLAPLLQWLPALAEWVPRQGRIDATADAEGRWPALRTQGRLDAEAVRVGPLALGDAGVDWRLATAGEASMSLQAEVTALQWEEGRAEELRADIQGTLASHRIELAATLAGAPPAALARVLGQQARAGTRADLQIAGRFTPAAGGGGLWQGDLQRLSVGGWDRDIAAAAGTNGGEWLDARALRAELQFGGGGTLLGAFVEPGQVRLAGTATLAWQQAAYDARGRRPAFALRAALQPLEVAPLLARAQPDLGWGGDLKMGGRIEISAADELRADVVLERAEGDLRIGPEGGALSLGLTGLRLALAADGGLWTVTAVMAGRTLGEVAGAVNVRTRPQALWPHADAPIEGVIEARVADIGIWNAWVPAGWRIAGALQTTATVGGRFGAPEYSGTLVGTGLGVRNVLQGVNVQDGQLALALQGDTARIDTFTLRGGDGTLTLSGGATFGEAPQARVTVTADDFRVLGRVDRRLVASGSAVLQLQADQLELDGRFVVDEGLFDITRADAPALDPDVTILRAEDRDADDAAATQAPRRRALVNVEVDLGRQLKLRGRGLDTLLRGQLRVSTPGGRLAVHGTVRTENGTYAAYGQKLEIARGIVEFSGPPDNPRLDILALRPDIDEVIGVAITGGVQAPRVRLHSETDMSEVDKLSWLVLGRAPDGLGQNDLLLLQTAALALLAGEGESQTDQVIRGLGLDEFSVRQTDGEVRDTVITVGKQLTRRWFVAYERGVNAASGNWQLIYRVARRITVRVQSGEDSALDVIWVWRID